MLYRNISYEMFIHQKILLDTKLRDQTCLFMLGKERHEQTNLHMLPINLLNVLGIQI